MRKDAAWDGCGAVFGTPPGLWTHPAAMPIVAPKYRTPMPFCSDFGAKPHPRINVANSVYSPVL
jgi:hypothetical protein